MPDIFTLLKDADDKKAYAFFREIKKESEKSSVHYADFEGFAELLEDASSYVRTRGFSLCCAQARWDVEGKLQRSLPRLLLMLRDDRPTAVRQCIKALYEVVEYRDELCDAVEAGLSGMELSKYSDSMRPLIKKDIDALIKKIDKQKMRQKISREVTL